LSLISEMSENPVSFVKNPGKDFTRDRKLPFETVVNLLISMGGNSIYKELLESQGYDVNTATTSAFIQQRDKILPEAFEFLLHKFTESYSDIKTYRGYRLLATDGSDLLIPTNPNDSDTYFQNHPGEKGYNLLHLNAMYDLCNRIYVDVLTQPKRQENEKKGLNTMVDRSRIEDAAIKKHAYQVNFTIAIHICKHFLRFLSNMPPPDVEALIRKNILPVRPGRKDKRKIRFRKAVSFLYRVA